MSCMMSSNYFIIFSPCPYIMFYLFSRFPCFWLRLQIRSTYPHLEIQKIEKSEDRKQNTSPLAPVHPWQAALNFLRQQKYHTAWSWPCLLNKLNKYWGTRTPSFRFAAFQRLRPFLPQQMHNQFQKHNQFQMHNQFSARLTDPRMPVHRTRGYQLTRHRMTSHYTNSRTQQKSKLSWCRKVSAIGLRLFRAMELPGTSLSCRQAGKFHRLISLQRANQRFRLTPKRSTRRLQTPVSSLRANQRSRLTPKRFTRRLRTPVSSLRANQRSRLAPKRSTRRLSNSSELPEGQPKIPTDTKEVHPKTSNSSELPEGQPKIPTDTSEAHPKIADQCDEEDTNDMPEVEGQCEASMDKEPVPPKHMPDLEFLAKIETLLCVNSPWCKLLAAGEKTWELRTYRTQQRPLCNCLGCFFCWFLLLECFCKPVVLYYVNMNRYVQISYIRTCLVTRVTSQEGLWAYGRRGATASWELQPFRIACPLTSPRKNKHLINTVCQSICTWDF